MVTIGSFWLTREHTISTLHNPTSQFASANPHGQFWLVNKDAQSFKLLGNTNQYQHLQTHFMSRKLAHTVHLLTVTNARPPGITTGEDNESNGNPNHPQYEQRPACLGT